MLSVLWPSGAQPLGVTWSHPAWAAPSQPFEGTAAFGAPEADRVLCHYRYAGAAVETVLCSRVEGDAYRFSIPPKPEAEANELTFWLEASSTKGTVQISEPVTVPRSEEVEIEVSGQTDVELAFPLDDWEASLLFKPCCLIISGWIHAERIPVLPASTREGLPEELLTPFFRIDPDELVEATGGVHVVASYDEPASAGVDPESIRPYQWKDGRWTTVFDPVHDTGNRNVRFHFATGGICVIGGNLSEGTKFEAAGK